MEYNNRTIELEHYINDKMIRTLGAVKTNKLLKGYYEPKEVIDRLFGFVSRDIFQSLDHCRAFYYVLVYRAYEYASHKSGLTLDEKNRMIRLSAEYFAKWLEFGGM